MVKHTPAPRSHATTTRYWLQALACVTLCILFTACGFRLKGVAPLPFTTLYTNISDNSPFGAYMRRAIVASSPDTQIVADPKNAQARLLQLANRQIRRELSIDAAGHVEDYELILEFIFQLTDGQGRMVLPPTTLRATREVPYDPNTVQAKQSEITMIFEDMQQSLVARVVRRLSAPDVAQAFELAQSQPIPSELQINDDPADADSYNNDTGSLNDGSVIPLN